MATAAGAVINTLEPIVFEEKLKKVKIENEELRLPRLNMQVNSKAELLYWADFVFSSLQTVDAADEADYFKVVKGLLVGDALDAWNTLFDALPLGTPLDVACLQQVMQGMVSKYVKEADRVAQLKWLRSQSCSRKTKKTMEVHMYWSHLKKIRELTETWMPGAGAITDQEMKEVFINGMPFAWQTNFMGTHGSITAGMNMEDVLAAFEDQQVVSRMREENEAQQAVKFRRDRRKERDQDQVSRTSNKKKRADVRRREPERRQHDSPAGKSSNKPNYCRHSKCKDAKRHLWEDCPNNWANQKQKSKPDRRDNNAKKGRRGETYAVESDEESV